MDHSPTVAVFHCAEDLSYQEPADFFAELTAVQILV
jgi:hypothetical protein